MTLEQLMRAADRGALQDLDLLSHEGAVYLVEALIDGSRHLLKQHEGILGPGYSAPCMTRAMRWWSCPFRPSIWFISMSVTRWGLTPWLRVVHRRRCDCLCRCTPEWLTCVI